MLILSWEAFYINPVTNKCIPSERNKKSQQGIRANFVCTSSHTARCSGLAVTVGQRQGTVPLIRHMAVLVPYTRTMTKNSKEDTASRQQLAGPHY